MKTVRRFLLMQVLSAVTFVTVGFLSLFFFIDFVDDLGNVGRAAYGLPQALMYNALLLPSRLYELMPISVLIGTIFVMARLAQTSEFTILRTSGLSPQRALRSLMGIGLMFGVLTFIIGDYLAPASDRLGQTVRATLTGTLPLGRAGAWLKDRQEVEGQVRSYAVNVGAVLPDGQLRSLRVYEFDAEGQLRSRTEAESASIAADGWLMSGVERTVFPATSRLTELPDLAQLEELAAKLPAVPSVREETWLWPTSLTRQVVTVAILRPDRMSTWDLFRYTTHLADNEQTAQRYEIEFWKKALYPLACLVMVVLALPFAYLHSRAGGIALKVFGGIMLGITFILLNNVFNHMGILRSWEPWFAAGAPSFLFFVLSLLAFGWLVRFR